MAEVILSPEASADLNDILIYGLINHGEATASTYLRGFNAAFKRLEDYPLSGQIDEEIGFRRCHYRSHRVFYRVNKDMVLIVRIIHHSRDVSGVE
jgi:toxin ParE1/3/4